jgi:hypothetical protein
VVPLSAAVLALQCRAPGKIGGWAVGLCVTAFLFAPLYVGAMLFEFGGNFLCHLKCMTVEPRTVSGFWITLGGFSLSLVGVALIRTRAHAGSITIAAVR